MRLKASYPGVTIPTRRPAGTPLPKDTPRRVTAPGESQVPAVTTSAPRDTPSVSPVDVRTSSCRTARRIVRYVRNGGGFVVDEDGRRLLVPVLYCPDLAPIVWRRLMRLLVSRGAFSKGETRLTEFLWSLGGAARRTGRILDREGRPMSGTELEGRYCRKFGVCRAIFWADWGALETRGYVYRAVSPAGGQKARHAEYGICLRADAIPAQPPREFFRLLRLEELAYTEPAPEAEASLVGSIADFARQHGPMTRVVKPLSRNQRRRLTRARSCGYREVSLANPFEPVKIKPDTSPLYARGDLYPTYPSQPAVSYQSPSARRGVENQKRTRQGAAGPGSIFNPPPQVVAEAERIVRRAVAMSYRVLEQDFTANVDAAGRASFVRLIGWNLVNLRAAGHNGERVVMAAIYGAMSGPTVINPFLAACARLHRNVPRRMTPDDVSRLTPTSDRRELLARRAGYVLPRIPRPVQTPADVAEYEHDLAGWREARGIRPTVRAVPSATAADGAELVPVAAPAEDLATWARRLRIAELDHHQDDEHTQAEARAAILALVGDVDQEQPAESVPAAAAGPDRAAVRAVPCPSCEATAGSPCRRPGRGGLKPMAGFHPSRTAAAADGAA